jgi:plasmid stabilization system protein ParE
MEKPLTVTIKDYALAQLKSEYEYYKKEYSADYAEKFRLDFFSVIEKIVPHTYSYPECRFLPTKQKLYRNIVWKNYLIVFKIKKDHIDILCLFHTRQNPTRLKIVKGVR